MTKKQLEKTISTILDELYFNKKENTYTVSKAKFGCGSMDGQDLAERIEREVEKVTILRYGEYIDNEDRNEYAEVVFKIKK